MSIVLNSSRALLATWMLAPLTATWPAENAGNSSEVLAEVVVSASRLREQARIDVPASVTVLSSQTLVDSAQQHFEEVLAQAPNLNWAAGSSRPRYFQIRGIGEREQYEGAPNASVGFLIDDIDFSGIGMAATLFDVDRIEILRGPQGTILGANALGGIIAVRSADPSSTYDARVVADAGNYSTASLSLSASGPVEAASSAWRFAAQKYRSDGFRKNSYLNRDDTNGRDELTLRGKWRWNATENGTLDVSLMHVDLDNNYDAFSIDNSRTTLSDHPGKDSQRVTAGSAKWQSRIGALDFTAIATTLGSDSIHSYDGDWGNSQSWLPYTYDFVYRANRERDARTLELRIGSASLQKEDGLAWLVGAYGRRLNERIAEVSVGELIDPDPIFGYVFTADDFLNSRFESTTAAVFAQLDGRFASRWTWATGLRQEKYRAKYRDAGVWGGDPARVSNSRSSDNMLGGNASLTFEASEFARIYAAVYRGYKAGGFNLGAAGTLDPVFEPEYLWNYEVGVKAESQDRTLYADLTLFYMDRKDMQVRTGEQLVPGDPNSFVFATKNVASGRNYGLESSVRWSPMTSITLGGSLGLLRTRESGSLDATGQPIPARAQAHAPEYQVQLNATYRHPRGLMARVDFNAVDEFYFDVPTDHDQRSEPYTLTNIKLGYETERWRLHVYMRNVFDRRYATRGFYFGNEPPNFDDTLYVQNGDPRTYGASVEWSLH